MPQAGFETTIPLFDRSRTVRALDSTTTGTGMKIKSSSSSSSKQGLGKTACSDFIFMKIKSNYKNSQGQSTAKNVKII
jgi:hypothetical protein